MSTTMSANDRLYAMTMAAEHRARALQGAYIGEAVSGAFSAIGRAVANLYRRWRESRDLRRSIAYLESLDERLLADIGLSRSSLEMELRDPTRMSVKAPAVDAMIAEAAPVNAANQDHRTERHAA